MIKKSKIPAWKRLLLCILPLGSSAGSAIAQGMQQTQISPLEQSFYNSGKIYVVVAVAGIILTGIFAVLIRTERKVSALERDFREQTKEA